MRTRERATAKEWALAIGVAVALVAFMAGIVVMVMNFNTKDQQSEELSTDLDRLVEQTEEVDGQPQIVEPTFSDDEIAVIIHKMSHQKVEADEKWGAIRITEDRLKALSDQIEVEKDNLANYDLFRSIVDSWMDGDFSRVDEQHNDVWNMQGGTIGKATGILTKQEENEFIDQNF